MHILKKLLGFGARKSQQPAAVPAQSADGAVLQLRGEELTAAMLADPNFAKKYQQAEEARYAAGSVDGKHFSAYASEVKALKKAKDYDAAVGLLLRLVDAVEAEARFACGGWYAVPAFHVDLAALYKRMGRRDLEAVALRRYVLLCSEIKQELDAGVMERLSKAQSAEVEQARKARQ